MLYQLSLIVFAIVNVSGCSISKSEQLGKPLTNISFYKNPYVGTMRGGGNNISNQIDKNSEKVNLSMDENSQLIELINRNESIKYSWQKQPFREYFVGTYQTNNFINHIAITNDFIILEEEKKMIQVTQESDLKILGSIISKIKSSES